MKKQIVLAILAVVLVNCGWLQADPFSNPRDFNNDRIVNNEDFVIFVSDWLWRAPDPNEFAYITADTFEMGDHHDSMSNALPVHTVTLNSFYMSKYQITNKQYCDYLNDANALGQIKVTGGVVYEADDTSNSFPYYSTSSAPIGYPDYGEDSQINYSGGVFIVNIKDGTTDMSNHPLVCVSWYGCVAYCNWKSVQVGLEICYDLSTWQCDFTKNGYRLPTEAEWEYAARGGNHSPYYRYPWGDSIDGSMANYWPSGDPYDGIGEYPWTTPVGYYDGGQIPAGVDMANGYGLYDMAGNVHEWCIDWYGETYYSTSPTNNPTGPTSGISRVLHGGHWGGYYGYCWVAYRYFTPPGNRNSIYGFRVCVLASH